MIEEIEKETEWMIKRQAEPVTYSKKDAHRSLRYKAKSPERIAALVEYFKAARVLLETPHVVRNYHNDFNMDEAMARYEAARAKLGLK